VSDNLNSRSGEVLGVSTLVLVYVADNGILDRLVGNHFDLGHEIVEGHLAALLEIHYNKSVIGDSDHAVCAAPCDQIQTGLDHDIGHCSILSSPTAATASRSALTAACSLPLRINWWGEGQSNSSHESHYT
jgi:hypothetical protein